MDTLQKLSLDTILDAQTAINKNVNFRSILEMFYPWTPRIDGKELTGYPMQLIQEGKFPSMPIMIGTVTNEAILFIYKASASPINDLEYIGIVEYVFGITTGARVLYKYPPTPFFGDKRPAVADLGTDYIFLCSTRNMTFNLAKSNKNVYLYRYDHTISFANQVWSPNYTECVDYVCHAEEILTEFGTPILGGFKYTKDEQVLSNLFMDYWTNFARNGNPNIGNKVMDWPSYSMSNMTSLLLQTPMSSVEVDYRSEDCNFFDGTGYHHGWRLNKNPYKIHIN